MRPDSRKLIHIGINFVVTPPPIIDTQKNVDFQNALISSGISLANAAYQKQKIEVLCQEPEPLHVAVNLIGPPVGQLLIAAPQPAHSLDFFIKNAKAVIKAYEQTWQGQKQIISRDATIRSLFEATSEHAFDELWQKRLGQSPSSLEILGKPVLGGGLRFVMPPKPDESEPLVVEVKIESFLTDVRKLFVETQFVWPKPTGPQVSFDPETRLLQLDRYIDKNVVPFIMGGKNASGAE